MLISERIKGRRSKGEKQRREKREGNLGVKTVVDGIEAIIAVEDNSFSILEDIIIPSHL